jgi:hypothetical protein
VYNQPPILVSVASEVINMAIQSWKLDGIGDKNGSNYIKTSE